MYMIKHLTALSFIFFSISAHAQDNYEIQVYGAQTQTKNSTIFESHSNFTFNGQKQPENGVYPSNHSFHETLEITHGITDNFELGVYLFTNYTPNHGYQIVGTHIRPRIMVPAKWNWPVGVSLSAEVGYQKTAYASDSWNVEVRPIIDKQWDKLYISFNPTFGVAVKSLYNNSVPVFEPNVKVGYGFFKKLSMGIEYYGSMGSINSFDKLPQQNHAVFAAVDMVVNPLWEFNAGAGFGLTPATDGFVFKVIVGRRINWKK